MARKPTQASGRISTIEEFHTLLPRIVERQAEMPELALAALANPLLAVERLGYEIAPELAREAERTLRFSPDQRKELATVEARLAKALGAEPPFEAPERLAELVLARIGGAATGPQPTARAAKAAPPAATAQAAAPGLREALLHRPVPVRPMSGAAVRDPLADFAGTDPVIADLVAWRAIEASRPRLADRETFERVLKERAAGPIRAVTFRYKPKPVRTRQGD